jgi:hypothetical protein
VSQSIGRSIVAFDRNSNKSVVFRATDGHLVAAYTGHAYLDGIPTDTFIAESLLGVNLSKPGGFFGVGHPASWTDVGRSVERLRGNLSAAFQRMPESDRAIDFQVSVLGWRQRRARNRRVTPVIWELRRSELRGEIFQIFRHQRWWRWDQSFTTTTVPDLGRNPILDWMRAELREFGAKSPDEVKRIIVEGLRRCAEERPQTVGRSCLQIVLTPAVAPHVRIRYILDTCSPTDLTPDGVGYSPWIVAPPMAYAPAVIGGGGGGFTNTATGYQWVLEGVAPPPGPKRFSQSSQRRSSDPRKRR